MMTIDNGRLIHSVLARSCILSLIVLVTSAMAVGSHAAPASDGDLPVITASLSLSDALRLADQDNIQIAQSQADSDSASASAAKAKSALQPTLSATTYATTGSEPSIF